MNTITVKALGLIEIRSTTGHVCIIPPNTPTKIPRAVLSEAMARGAVPVNDDGETVGVAEVHGALRLAIGGELRSSMIVRALNVIMDRNISDDFTGGGTVKVGAVKELVGFEVQAKEVNELHQSIRVAAENKAPIVLHEKTDLAFELIECSSRKDLEAVAKANNLKGYDKVKTLPFAAAKAELVNSLVSGG